MAKYVQPNFIVESSANFTNTVKFNNVTTFNSRVDLDTSTYVNDQILGSMIYESSINYYDASTVDTKFTVVDTSATVKFESTDASIERLDASLNDVIDIGEIIDASLNTKVDKAGDTMTGQLVFDNSAGFRLDNQTITTIDTSVEGFTGLNTALPTSGFMKDYVDSKVSDGVVAWNGLSKSDDGSIGLGGIVSESVTLTPDTSGVNFAFGEPAAPFEYMWLNSKRIELHNELNGVNFEMTTDGSMIISDNNPSVKFQGLRYLNDLSTNFVDRSLVDKGYVDAKISSEGFVLSDGNGTTANGTGVDLGGVLSKDTSIDASSNSIEFNNAYIFKTKAKINSILGIDNDASEGINQATFGVASYGLVARTNHANASSLSSELTMGYTVDSYDEALLIGNGGSNGAAKFIMGYNDTQSSTDATKMIVKWQGNPSGVFAGIEYDDDYSDNFALHSLVDKSYVDAKISSEGFVLTDGNGTTANGTGVDLGGVLYADTDIDVSGNVLSITGGLSIYGDLTVDGSTTTVNSVNLDVSDNIITVNAGETGAGVSRGFAGLKVDRGTENDYVFVFEESTDTFRIGIENEPSLGGNTQAVATREDSPIAAGIGYWNATEDRIDTALGFTYDAVDGLSLGILQPNDNSSNKALVQDGSGLIGYRTLGSNAYTSTDYATQDAMTAADASITRIDASISQLIADASTQAGKYKGVFDGTSGTSVVIAAGTHGQGVGPFIISVYEDRIEVIPEISFNTSGDITIEWASGSLNANCSYMIVG